MRDFFQIRFLLGHSNSGHQGRIIQDLVIFEAGDAPNTFKRFTVTYLMKGASDI